MDLRQKILSTVHATVHEHRHGPSGNDHPPGTGVSDIEADIHVTATAPADNDSSGGEADGLPRNAQQSGQKSKWTEHEILGVLQQASTASASKPAAAPPPHSSSFGAAAAAFLEAGAAGGGGGSRGGGSSSAAAGGGVEDTGPSRVQRFLMRLAVALHAYGSSAARTEFLIERAGRRLGVDANVAVFPDLILLSFNRVAGDDTAGQRAHMLSVTPDMDLDKLGRVDELARSVGLQETHNLMAAYWQLRAIANAPPTFSPALHLLAMALMSASAAVLFFGGNMWDALVAGVLGFLGGAMEFWAINNSQAVASILEFLVSVLAAFSAHLLAASLLHGRICIFASLFGALVWFLPGVTLTFGVNELVARTLVTGTSRVAAAIFTSLQIGFGISVGMGLAYGTASPTALHDCPPSTLPLWSNIIWFALYVVASNIRCNARLDQWDGMTLVALVGYVVSELAYRTIGNDTASVVAAFAVSTSGTLFSHFAQEFPLAMKISGIQLLVPGGIGVRGVAAILNQDVMSGIGFVFEMLTVGLAITIGLILANLVLPESMFAHGSRPHHNKRKLAADLRADSMAHSGIGGQQEGARGRDEGAGRGFGAASDGGSGGVRGVLAGVLGLRNRGSGEDRLASSFLPQVKEEEDSVAF
ncbi:hypothetical protein CLOM_g19295 [Closterium sp. NIES-68]|nr:hypothetical protein CLOM_g19295 [Closterium sp. NIES-68]GJP58917.1 hypothetical protein CLOP_g6688 [Closterium sp. NIES-67]